MANFEYKKARKKAPQSVQQRIEEYDNLSKEDKAKIPLLYWILGTGTPPYKMSKEDSHYIDESTDVSETCGNCKFLYHQPLRNSYICSKIRGNVAVEGWCKFWKDN